METVLFWILIASAVAFVIQTLFGILGADVELDDGSGGFFTIRNVISFLLGFSVVGYLTLRNDYGGLPMAIGGACFGIVLVFANMGLMKLLSRLEQKNEIQTHEYRGIYATVTIKIQSGGIGKVEFVLNGRIDEMQAVSDEETDIEKGTQVQVERLQDNGMLLVHRLTIN